MSWSPRRPKSVSYNKYGKIPAISLQQESPVDLESLSIPNNTPEGEVLLDPHPSNSFNEEHDNNDNDNIHSIIDGRLLSVPSPRNSTVYEDSLSRTVSESSTSSRPKSRYSIDSDQPFFDALVDDDNDAISNLKDDIKNAIGGKNGSGVWLQPQNSGLSTASNDHHSKKSSRRNSQDIELGFIKSAVDTGRSEFDQVSGGLESPFNEPSSPVSFTANSSRLKSLATKLFKSEKAPYSIDLDTAQTSYSPEVSSNLSDQEEIPITPTPTYGKLYGKSLCLFPSHNSYRLTCSRYLQTTTYNQTMKLILLLQTSLLAYRQWNPRVLHGYVLFGMSWADYILIVLNVLYTIDVLANMIAWGFWDDSQLFDANHWYYASFYEISGLEGLKFYFMGQPEKDDLDIQRPFKRSMTFNTDEIPYSDNVNRAYLRKTWNRIDFISTVAFWIGLLLSINRTDVRADVPFFRALSCLRIIKVTTFLTRISLILRSVKLGLPQLTDVFLFVTYFWCFFAIIGVQSFKSSLRRFCVWTNPDDPTDTYVTEQYCGGYYAISNGSLSRFPYLIDGGFGNKAKGFLCPVNSKCETLQNANGNTYGFDNILSSMQMTFVVMSGNTFSNIMYDTMDTDTMASSLFFICGIFFLLLWMINLVIAVISESFRNVMESEKTAESKNDDFKLDWGFPKNIFTRIYLDFKVVFEIIILASIIILCLRDLDSTPEDLSKGRKSQATISFILLIEIILRFILYFPTWRSFFFLKRNLFDLVLAIVTCLMSIPEIYSHSERVYEWFVIFFLLRFYRLVILVSFTRRLWAKVWKNISIIMNLSFFYFLTLFLVSIIFARYFENFADEESIEEMSYPFHTLPNVILGLFTITSTENWSDIMFSLEGIAPNKAATFFSGVLFIMWFLLSSSIILNIFIAIIGDSLNITEAAKRKEQVKKFVFVDFPNKLQAFTQDSVLSNWRSRFTSQDIRTDQNQEIQKLLLNGAAVQAFLKHELEELEENNQDSDNFDDEDQPQKSRIPGFIKTHLNRIIKNKYVSMVIRFFLWNDLKQNPFHSNQDGAFKGLKDDNFTSLAQRYRIETQKNAEDRELFLQENPNFNMALYVLKPRQPLRKLCQKIVYSSHGHRYDGVEPNKVTNLIFTGALTCATLLLIVVACYITPIYKQKIEEHNYRWTFYLELSFAILFLIEFFIKIIADGVYMTPNGYLKNVWNVIDFVVLCSIWINVIAIIKDDPSLSRLVGGLKALRALRLLTVNENSRNIFQKVMIAGFGKILGASILAFSLLLPFSIWGLNLFSGRLGTCNDGGLGRDDCANEYYNNVFNWDILSPRAYEQPQLEFNRFASALLTVFEVISLEGWTDLLSNLVNSTGVGTPAQPYATPINAVFIVAFVFVGMIFIMTLFVSVIINNYSSLTGSAFLTFQQISWREVSALLGQIDPRTRPMKENLNKFRAFCFRYTVEKNVYVSAGYRTLLWIHILAIMLEKYPSEEALDNFRYAIYFISSTLFFTFTLMKLTALGPQIFFRTRWNVYEFFVFLGAFGTSFAAFFTSRSTAFSNVNKLFLVGIFTVLIHISNRLSHLLKIVSASVTSLLSLMFTWFVLFLVYAIALNQIFGLTRLGPNTSNNINLRTVTKGILLLFKDSFGEGWNYVMKDFAVEYPYCVSSDQFDSTDCGNETYAYILFISWNILSMYIFVNMFISLIFESFSYLYGNNGDATSLDREEIRKFKTEWQKFDPLGSGYIDPKDLTLLLRSLDGYFSFKIMSSRWSIPELTRKFKIRSDSFSNSPYDMKIDLKGLYNFLNKLDVNKVKSRKLAYERLIEECTSNMETHEEPGISFKRLILLIPLYSKFDESNCLLLTDFLDRLIISRKINKKLQYKHVMSSLKMIVLRWRFLKLKNPGKVLRYKANKISNSDNVHKVFDTPLFTNSKGSFDYLGTGVNQTSTEEAYWSPVESPGDSFFKDNENERTIAGEAIEDLENSRWANEIKSTNQDFEEFLETSRKFTKRTHKRKEGKSDSSSDEDGENPFK